MGKKYKKSKEKFINPYNFISLEEKCNKGIDYKKITSNPSELYTGYIECELETKTPIFIPNTSDSSQDIFTPKTREKIKSYDFFSYTNLEGQSNPKPPEPVIPGSEIRGMIRSVFEALTNSCMSTVDEDKIYYKRTTSPNTNCGLLNHKDKKWIIWKCKKYGIATRDTKGDPNNFSKEIKNFYDGQEVYVKSYGSYITKKKHEAFPKVDSIKLKKTKGYKKGWFHRGEKFGSSNRKHHESVFVLIDGHEIVPEEAVKYFLENLKLYNNPKINLYKKSGDHKGYEQIAKDLNKKTEDLKIEDMNGLPVYYNKVELPNGKKYYYLSPAEIGREVFYNSLKDILEKNGGYQPCSNLEDLCPACSLFGLAVKKDKDKNIAIASRVRFTDAIIPEDKRKQNKADYFEPIKILPELASPKPSATEFYLKKPDNAHMWNYDYAFNWENYDKIYIDNYTPAIRGRKFYWHHKIEEAPFLDPKKDSKAISERNVAVRPLKKGITFSFKVYFNDLTIDELKKLIWVLEIGGKDEHYHKIGMGKPIGLGSVDISIENVMQRVIKIENETITYKLDSMKELLDETRSKEKPQNLLGCSKNVLEEFLKISDFNCHKITISYPKNINSDKSYEWFVANKQVAREDKTCGKGNKPIICQELPNINKPELLKYQEKNNRK